MTRGAYHCGSLVLLDARQRLRLESMGISSLLGQFEALTSLRDRILGQETSDRDKLDALLLALPDSVRHHFLSWKSTQLASGHAVTYSTTTNYLMDAEFIGAVASRPPKSGRSPYSRPSKVRYPTRLQHGANLCLAFLHSGHCPRPTCPWQHDLAKIEQYRGELLEELRLIDQGARARNAGPHHQLSYYEE
jgi:hypothetical protein